LQLLKGLELSRDAAQLIARDRVAFGLARQLVDRPDQWPARLAEQRIVVAQLVVDDSRNCRIKIEFGLVGNVQKAA
jgi:hypothetical protein